MKVNGIEILVGSDPELFVKKDNAFLSGHDLIPGTKEEPHPVRGVAVQVDGTALEFNTVPAKNRRAFHRSTNAVLKALQEMIPDELVLVANPTARFAREYMRGLPEKALELGCDPDYNAYSGMQNPVPNANLNFRTGAGHIHVGWTDVEDPFDANHMSECRALVQAMDVFLGAPSILIDRDDDRRRLYGKAGAFRPKTYGVEYRVLSNFWVLNPLLRGWVYNNTIEAVKRMMDHDNALVEHYGYPAEAINGNDREYARKVIGMFDVPLPRSLAIAEKKKRLDRLVNVPPAFLIGGNW
mgnify:CR=1 FL=1